MLRHLDDGGHRDIYIDISGIQKKQCSPVPMNYSSLLLKNIERTMRCYRVNKNVVPVKNYAKAEY